MVLCGLCATMSAIGGYQTVFTDAFPEYRCKLPMLENDTFTINTAEHQKLVDLYIPPGKAPNQYDGCHVYNNISANNNSRSKEECNSWVFSNEYYETTIVTEWNLVCGNVALKGYFRSIYFAGSFSIILMGILADRYGRKKVAFIFIFMNSLTFLSMALSVNFIKNPTWKMVMFGLSRFGIGLSVNTFALVCVIVVEIVGPSYRVLANVAMSYFWILGELSVLVVAYFNRDYRVISIYTFVAAICLVLVFSLVPESVRYLVSQKRYKEADEIFKHIAHSNKRV